MSFDESYTADVKAIAVVQAAGMDGSARNAEAKLASLHRDLPEMVKFSVDYLGKSGIDVGASKVTAHRLTEALMRQAAIRPQQRLSVSEKYDASDAAMRSVLVQEAAAYEYEARTGQKDTFREFMGDRTTSNGANAMERLEKQKVDTVALYGQASDMELTQMSVGAFDRTGRAQQERTAKVLDMPMMPEKTPSSDKPEVERTGNVIPIRGPITRHPHGDARRPSPSFGRRMSPALAMAGQGI